MHYLLMKTQTSLNRWILSQAAALGLSPGQPKVLECLMQCGQSNQKAIARYCEIEPATVGSILSRMERDGLIQRQQRDGNRRSLYVSLTGRGEQLGRQMQNIFAEADQRAMAGLTPEQQQTLQQLLEQVLQNFNREEGTENP